MKDKIKIILINFILLFIIILCSELYLEYREYINLYNSQNISQNRIYHINQIFNKSFIKSYVDYTINFYKRLFHPNFQYNSKTFRTVANPFNKNNKQSRGGIILLGCSYTYGIALDNKEAFHSVLSKYTNRTVYNLGVPGEGLRIALFLMRENFLFTQKNLLQNNNKIEYIIYTYIPDHKRRLYFNLVELNIPFYKVIKNNNESHLKFLNNPSFFRNTFLYRNIMRMIYEHKNKYSKPEIFNLYSLYIKEINNEIKLKFNYKDKPAKFIILVFQEEGTEDWDSLKAENIDIIKLEDITHINFDSHEYKSWDNAHPSKEVWEIVVPALVKELKLN